MTYTMIFRKKFTSGLLAGEEITDSLDFTSDRAALGWMTGCDINIVRGILDWEFTKLPVGGHARYIVMHDGASREYLIKTFEAWLVREGYDTQCLERSTEVG